jgi:non-ribosomal peptide synthetase component F
VANRNRSEVEGLIGFFANTLPLRARPEAGMPFRGLLARVREHALGAYAHQDVPFERIVEDLQVPRSLAYNPLFQVLIVLQNATSGTLELPGVTLELMEPWSEVAKVDFVLTLSETGGGLAVNAEYATGLYEEVTISRLVSCLREVLERVAAEPDVPLASLPLLPAPARSQVLSAAPGGAGERAASLEDRLMTREQRVAALRSHLSDRQKAALARLRTAMPAPRG